MASEIKLKVINTIGGEEHEIESPVDIRAEDFIRDLITALRLPFRDAEGNPIAWRIDDKNTARTLDGDRTLEENGVKEGHVLRLIRSVIAGS